MRRIILHVGFSKTGSSALQAFLCRHPVLAGREAQYRYYTVRNGQALTGKPLARKARWHPLGYLATEGSVAEAALAVSGQAEEGSIPILSQESWGHKTHELTELDAVLQSQGCKADVIAFIRPQTDWFQSAWWQWYAWEKPALSPAAVWRQLVTSGYADWASRLEAFAGLSSIGKVTLRLFDPGKGIAASFLEALGVEPDAGNYDLSVRSNPSLAPAHIRLYRMLPGLRQPHRGTLDGVVTRLIPSGGKAPSVVTPELARSIREDMAPCNQKLLTWLSSEEAEIMKADPRWWS